MSISLYIICLAVPFTMIFSIVLPVATGVGGCGCPIYAREVRMDVEFWQFSNNPPNSTSVSDAVIFLIIPNSTCMGPCYGGISVIDVLL